MLVLSARVLSMYSLLNTRLASHCSLATWRCVNVQDDFNFHQLFFQLGNFICTRRNVYKNKLLTLLSPLFSDGYRRFCTFWAWESAGLSLSCPVLAKLVLNDGCSLLCTSRCVGATVHFNFVQLIFLPRLFYCYQKKCFHVKCYYYLQCTMYKCIESQPHRAQSATQVTLQEMNTIIIIIIIIIIIVFLESS